MTEAHLFHSQVNVQRNEPCKLRRRRHRNLAPRFAFFYCAGIIFPMKEITIGILAHVDAGKTTCIESMLYHSGVIRRMGRVDTKDAAMDTDPQERSHGITIYAKEARITWKDTTINLIDTPGHVDFSQEMERALSVIDLAVVLISGLDGTQAHTETIMSLLAHYDIPVLFFVNKMDISKRSEEELFQELEETFHNCVRWNEADTMENIATSNEAMMEAFVETGSIPDDLIRLAFSQRQFFPVFYGSALKDFGVEELLDGIAQLAEEKQWPEEFGARVFRVTNGEEGQRTHVRITGGSLSAKQKISDTEKADRIEVLNGTTLVTVPEVHAGEIAVISGLRSIKAGQGLGFETNRLHTMLEPCMVYELETPNDHDRRILADICRELSEEDPTLSVAVDEETGAIRISIMGEMQKEILQHRIKDRTGLSVDFGTGRIIYHETIREAVHGAGHFEPLRHYAEVHVRLEPGERNSGIEVFSEVSTDELPMHWQNAILSALRTIPHRGVLTGSLLTDVRIILTAGKGHLKHTEGGDFRNAARRAVRQALMKADSYLLEPFASFELQIAPEYVSHALYDLETRGASVSVEENGSTVRISGSGPQRTLMNYQAELTAYTRGTGRCRQQVVGYQECADPKPILEQFAYDPLSDLRNPPGSVFCTHGSSFQVSWEEADAFMNIPVKDRKAEGTYSHRTYQVSEADLNSIIAAESGKNRNPNKKKRTEPEEETYRSKPKPVLPACMIIDGYNMIHGFASTRYLVEEDLSSAREHLIDELAAYQAYVKIRMIVVFDGYKRKDNYGSSMKQGLFEVVYTRTGQTADEYIEKLASELSRSYELTVATSDALIQNAVFAQGAVRISARMLEAELERVKKMFSNEPGGL